jgi:hypothetical protein
MVAVAVAAAGVAAVVIKGARELAQFHQAGHVIIPNVLTCVESARVSDLIDPKVVGTRCLLGQHWCASLCVDIRNHSTLSKLIPIEYAAVQCTYFEKSAKNNWLVPIHQDLSIPVKTQVLGAELKGWSLKEGVWFVQPPIATLERLIAVRIHLDECREPDGPLRVVSGSHRMGRLNTHESINLRTELGDALCELGSGDALVMSPLILHASSKSSGNSRRRVLHFVFAPPLLEYGLSWNISIT